MPRKPRIEYDGAMYHVMSRGDRQEPIFFNDSDRCQFLKTLEHACLRMGWIIHSYVLMPNHYHLLLETPESTLVKGMHWLQTTYTVRFNVTHNLKGHLFQGRYKALLIDTGQPDYFRRVSTYIHLNPVRANLLEEKDALEAYRWSSYPVIIGKRKAPEWLCIQGVLDSHNLSARGYRKYISNRHLELFKDPDNANSDWKDIRRGWFIGSEDFRRDLIGRLDQTLCAYSRESYAGDESKQHDEEAAHHLLVKALQALSVNLDTVRAWKTTRPEKGALIWLLRSSTSVSSLWLCDKLQVGHRSNISRAVRAFDTDSRQPHHKLKSIMLQCKD